MYVMYIAFYCRQNDLHRRECEEIALSTGGRNVNIYFCFQIYICCLRISGKKRTQPTCTSSFLPRLIGVRELTCTEADQTKRDPHSIHRWWYRWLCGWRWIAGWPAGAKFWRGRRSYVRTTCNKIHSTENTTLYVATHAHWVMSIRDAVPTINHQFISSPLFSTFCFNHGASIWS